MDNEADGWDAAPVLELDELPPDPLSAEDFEASLQALLQEFEPADPIAEGIAHVARLQRRRAVLEAEEARALADLARLAVAEAGKGADLGVVYRSLAAELALACQLSDRTVQARLGSAEILVEKFPQTLAALEAGSIGVGHARVIVDCGLPIGDPESRAKYERAVLDRAVQVTPGRLRRQARLAAARLAEVSVADRHQTAREARSVRLEELEDGMAELVHTVPTVYAVAMLDRLTAQVTAVKTANPADPRSLDQVRADLAMELMLTGQPSGHPDAPHAAGAGIRAEVSILIPALTLLGRGEEPASVAGKGPIGLKDALALAGNAPELIRVLTHPVDQQVLAVDTYRPSAKLRRFIRARDGRCRCPSCTRPARWSDIDHTLAWARDGKTRDDNLACLCPSHHTIKHLPGWSVKQTSPGVLEWTTPHGVIATDRPDTPITFQ